jgi:cell division protein FtsL
VAQTRPLVAGLNSSGVSTTVAMAGQLVGALLQGNRLTGALDEFAALAGEANRGDVVGGLGRLLHQVPAASVLIAQLNALVASVQAYHLVPRAATAMSDIGELVRLQRRTLTVQLATLGVNRRNRDIAKQTLATAQATLAAAQRILTIAAQTLGHAASLDSKVGPVP